MQESELLIDFLFPFAADRITSVSLVTNGEGRQSTPTDSVMNVLLWCNAPSRNYFCATEIAESKKGIFLFPLVEMLLSPKGTKPLEEF